MLKTSFILLFFVSACSSAPSREKADPIEGLWKLSRIECASAKLTEHGLRTNDRLKKNLDSMVFEYRSDGIGKLIGKSFESKVDQIHYCQLSADLEWSEKKIPSECSLNSKTTPRGEAATAGCKEAFPFYYLVCVVSDAVADEKSLTMSVNEPDLESNLTQVKKICEDKKARFIFDRVL